MISKLKLICLIITLSLVVGGCNVSVKSDEQTKKHINRKSGDVICNFSDGEKERIFDCFNVKIPEQETSAYIYSFSKIQSDKGLSSTVEFVIEFENVMQSSDFLELNHSRVKENGLDGLSDNELLNYNTDEYYITYTEIFYTELADDNELYKSLNNLFNELKETRNGNED